MQVLQGYAFFIFKNDLVYDPRKEREYLEFSRHDSSKLGQRLIQELLKLNWNPGFTI